MLQHVTINKGWNFDMYEFYIMGHADLPFLFVSLYNLFFVVSEDKNIPKSAGVCLDLTKE